MNGPHALMQAYQLSQPDIVDAAAAKTAASD